jgi:hypothetical protein
MVERRTAERTGFDYSIEFDPGAAAGKTGGKICRVQAQDICSDGLKVISDYPLEQGMVVRLGLPVRDLKTLIPVFAEVAWSVPADNRFRAGLRFLK